MRAPLIGLFLGILLDLLIFLSGPLLLESGISENVLIPVATPLAYVISWITGISTSHESGLLLLVISVYLTFPLLGLISGFLYKGIQSLLNRKNA
jgi:hypothetical protein